ncbi:MAG TPA: hypothetical protein VKZ63_05820 [Kofleriaceae bacterium]|nr:hypothetical protein [Kofleriaceae bacterium]
MRRVLAVGLWLGLLACSRAGEEESGKRAPIPPPPPAVDLPAGLHIPVEVDGAPAEPITRDSLTRIQPDFADDERRAWRLSRVLPSYRAGAVVEAVGREGVSITLPRPDTLEEPQPVLFFTRRGDVVAMVVRPEDPFPRFHGQGGRLRRPGDLTPRVSPVIKLRVHTRGISPPPAPTAP